MKKGFTLIELLVVISIITILSTVGLNTFSGIQSKTRDSVRKNDLTHLAQALEIYLQKNGKYVLGTGDCQGNTASSTFYDEIQDYLNSVPKDPKTADPYCYEALDDGLNYKLYAKLENCDDPKIIQGIDCQSARYNFATFSEEFIAALPSTSPYSYPSPESPASPYSYPTPINYPSPAAPPPPLPPIPTPTCPTLTFAENSPNNYTINVSEQAKVTVSLSSWANISKIEVYKYKYARPLPTTDSLNWQLLGTITPSSQNPIQWQAPSYAGNYPFGTAVYNSSGTKVVDWNSDSINCIASAPVKSYTDRCSQDSPVYASELQMGVVGNNALIQWHPINSNNGNDTISAYVSDQAGFSADDNNRVMSRFNTNSNFNALDVFNLDKGQYFYKIAGFNQGEVGPISSQAETTLGNNECSSYFGPPNPSQFAYNQNGNYFTWKYGSVFTSGANAWYIKGDNGFNLYIPTTEVRATNCYWWWCGIGQTTATWVPTFSIPAGNYTIQGYGGCNLTAESNPTYAGAPPTGGEKPANAPTDVAATASQNGTVSVTWQYPNTLTCLSYNEDGCESWSTPDVQGFHIYRSQEPLDLSKSSPTNNTNSLYQYAYFPNLSSGSHYFAVKTSNSCGAGWSNYIKVNIP